MCQLAGFSCSSSQPELDGSPNFIFFLVDDHDWYVTPIKMDDHINNSNMPYKNMPNLVKFAQGAIHNTSLAIRILRIKYLPNF